MAIIPLAVAESYVFTIFFKAWLVIVLFGTGNAIILLPCCLYFLSPWIKLLHNEVPVEKSDQLENNEDNNPINEGVEIK